FVRGSMKKLALFGEYEPTRMPVKQRHPEFALERRDLPRYRGLGKPQLLSGMGEASGFCGSMKNLELVPIHDRLVAQQAHSAAMRGSAAPCAARKRSASSAAMHPCPAAVTACR